jgi:hypothetical protein
MFAAKRAWDLVEAGSGDHLELARLFAEHMGWLFMDVCDQPPNTEVAFGLDHRWTADAAHVPKKRSPYYLFADQSAHYAGHLVMTGRLGDAQCRAWANQHGLLYACPPFPPFQVGTRAALFYRPDRVPIVECPPTDDNLAAKSHEARAWSRYVLARRHQVTICSGRKVLALDRTSLDLLEFRFDDPGDEMPEMGPDQVIRWRVPKVPNSVPPELGL